MTAPDMAEALRQLLREVDDMTKRVGWSGNGGRDAARAALAKAAKADPAAERIRDAAPEMLAALLKVRDLALTRHTRDQLLNAIQDAIYKAGSR